ncbi:hypothetical protein ZTR_05832 [Talaromyces verruculosus]|nr:hypothetical protein ZTR_05832 [Talaromyces verruculosus]
MAENSPKFRVLIAGAGIAGLATAIALSRISNVPNLDIQLYEQAPELTEIGASIALSPNGMRTLEKLGVHNALTDENGFRGPSGIPQIVRGHLHSALLQHVPRESIHLNKKVSGAVATDEGVALYFEDGTEAHGDLLIGADGIKSRTRQAFIPEYKLKFSGKVFARSTFDASIVEGKIRDLPVDSVHWWGPKDNFFASRLGKGQYTTVGAYDDGRTTEELEKEVSWDQAGNVKHLREKYKNWNPIVKALTELTPYTRLYPNYAGEALPTWVLAARATLVGDAAHTHGGAFAAGGSLALDDSFALSLALRHAFSLAQLGAFNNGPSNVRRALELYDQTRRPHTGRLLEIVHGQINKKPEVYGSPEEENLALISKMTNRPDTTWLSEHDVTEAFQRVLENQQATRKERTGAQKSRL